MPIELGMFDYLTKFAFPSSELDSYLEDFWEMWSFSRDSSVQLSFISISAVALRF